MAEPAALLVAGEPVPVRRALDERHRARHPADQLGLDPAPARRLAAASADLFEHNELAVRADPLAPAVPGRRSGAAARRPTTTSSPRRPGSSWPAARSRGSPRATRWRRAAARLLERELDRNTFPSGIGRELASDYQGFVAELGLLAAVEAEAAGAPAERGRLAAAVRDDRQRARRCSTSGCGRPARATATKAARCCSTPRRQPLAVAAGARATRCSAGSTGGRAVAAGRGQHAHRRAGRRRRGTSPAGPRSGRARFADAGITLLRTDARATSPRSGAAATAARTASSASPRTRTPTRCRWRSGTAASTSSPTRAPTATTASPRGGPTSGRRSRTTPSSWAARASPAEGGPFLWLRHANGQGDRGARHRRRPPSWTAEHDGYLALDPPARHRRSVRLDRAARSRRDHRRDRRRRHDLRLAFHLGPEVEAELDGGTARSCAGPDAASAGHGAAGAARRSCGGACTAARPTRSSAGTPAASVTAFPRSRSSVRGGPRPASRLVTRLEFAGPSQSRDLRGSR